MTEIKEEKPEVQTEPTSRRLPPRTCGNRYVEDEDFVIIEKEVEIEEKV